MSGKIEKVHVEGYQSLYDVEFELGQLTVFVGEGDQGKSAIVRALGGWAANESVDGEGDNANVVSWDGRKNLCVTVSVDGKMVKWVKGGGKNQYKIEDMHGIDTFDKVGLGVPTKVVDLTGIRDISLEKGDSFWVQIADQFDAPFLLGSDSTQLSKLFSIITHIDELNSASLNVQREEKRLKSSVQTQQESCEARKRKIVALTGVEELAEKMKVTRSLKLSIEHDVAHYERVEQARKLFEDVRKRLDEVNRKLSVINSQVVEIASLKESLVGDVEKLKSCEKFEELNRRINVCIESQEAVKGTLDSEMEKLKAFLLEAGVCPFCGSTVGKDSIDSIMRSL